MIVFAFNIIVLLECIENSGGKAFRPCLYDLRRYKYNFIRLTVLLTYKMSCSINSLNAGELSFRRIFNNILFNRTGATDNIKVSAPFKSAKTYRTYV